MKWRGLCNFFLKCKCGGVSQERTAGVVKVLAGW